MTENELIALLTLQHIPHLGDGSIKKLIKIFGSAEEVLQQKKASLLNVDGIGEHKLQSFWDEKHTAFAKAELSHIQTHNITYSCYTDADYPQRLKHCIDGPVVLFQRGNIAINNRKIISIVGTRKITTYGAAFIKKFIEEIAPFDPIIVSGFAYGVDITAHKAAVAHNLQTIGVLAHGLNQMYPKVHSKYEKEVEAHGGFMTDFWTTDTFIHTNFLRRNRIIAGLSEATIVIESAAKGGSLVSADFANGYHRDVFAVPGRADDALSIGCNNLIKQNKAHMLTSAADLAYILNWTLKENKPSPIQKKLFVELDEEEKCVWRFLKEQGKEQLDLIALHCKLPTYKIASTLLTMELKGVVRPLPGKLFELV
ncbi:DNA-processing protein DprA [Dokdonia sp.]|uniref:DNA-processing protein DprA n=1 Tax=Dokdonia sp. TaxID=2024995 RepID=UPI003265C6FA